MSLAPLSGAAAGLLWHVGYSGASDGGGGGGVAFSLLPWAIDWALGITPALGRLVSTHGMHWSELFYHQHRLGHLPRVRCA